MGLSEDLLQFIWKHRLFNQNNLHTFSGKPLHLNKTGRHNIHSGPDFEDASLFINNINWIGNVEVHVSSSDWKIHKHQEDKAYNNVVLHVVYYYDEEVKRADGTVPETLVLMPLIKKSVLLNYRKIMTNMHWIPCERLIDEVDPFYINHWLSGVLVERLMEKSKYVFHLLDQHQGDWEEVCYIILARSFGFKTNSDAFEMLARSLPKVLISKNKNNNLAIEALLFGQSGLLQESKSKENYPVILKKEYDYLKMVYSLKEMDKHVWRFLRMRPAGFPSMRIAQFAAFCYSNDRLFSRIIEVEDISLYHEWLSNLPVNDFWKSHYHFNSKSEKLHGNQLGKEAKHSILLNVISVILFAYGQFIGSDKYVSKAVNLLESLSAEKNQIIRQFDKLGVKCENAAQSQALIQLKTIYCDEKRCLDCEIGLQIIKSE